MENSMLLQPRRSTEGKKIKILLSCLVLGAGVVAAATLVIGASRVFLEEDRDHSVTILADTKACETKFRDSTLKTAYEMPMVGLFKDIGNEDIFEASSVTLVDDKFYVIADSSWRIFEVDPALPPYSDLNTIYPPSNARDLEGDSGYEAIFHVSGEDFVVVRESIFADHWGQGEKEYRAIVEEVTLNKTAGTYDVVRQCHTEQLFEGDSKGFEGAIHAWSADGTMYILGLCEGNYCAEGDRGKDKGHGRLVLMKHEEYEGGCVWRTVRTLNIPKTADFTDYSAITMHRHANKVAISSQEDSRVWIGDISLFDADGNAATAAFLHPEKSELSGGVVVDLPRNQNCDVVYCNVEGLHFLDAGGDASVKMLVAVSDRMKKRQDFRCFEKDQSVHVFVLPHSLVKT